MESTFVADQRKMSPWPKLVYRGSMATLLGSAISSCGSLLLHTYNIGCIFVAAFVISAVSFAASNHFYTAQQKRMDRGGYKGGKNYKLAFYGASSMYVISGVSMCVGMSSLLLGGDVETFAGIMMFSCIALGTGFILDELRGDIKNRDQRRADGSLDENKEEKNSGFLNRLKNFNLIAKSESNQNSERDNLNEYEEGRALSFFRNFIRSQKNIEEHSLLEEFNENEEENSLIHTGRVMRNSSGYGAIDSGYKPISNTAQTTSAL